MLRLPDAVHSKTHLLAPIHADRSSHNLALHLLMLGWDLPRCTKQQCCRSVMITGASILISYRPV